MPLTDALSSPTSKAPVVQGGAINSKCLKRSKQELRAEDSRFRLSSAKPSILYAMKVTRLD